MHHAADSASARELEQTALEMGTGTKSKECNRV